MNEFKGTPGPWKSGGWLDDQFSVYRDDKSLDRVAILDEGEGERTEANAALIVAAPDLLEAVQGLLICMRLAGWEDDAMAHLARSALEKALGEKP